MSRRSASDAAEIWKKKEKVLWQRKTVVVRNQAKVLAMGVPAVQVPGPGLEQDRHRVPAVRALRRPVVGGRGRVQVPRGVDPPNPARPRGGARTRRDKRSREVPTMMPRDNAVQVRVRVAARGVIARAGGKGRTSKGSGRTSVHSCSIT